MAKFKVKQKKRGTGRGTWEAGHVQLYVGPQLARLLDDVTREEGLTRSAFVRQAIRHCLGELGYEVPDPEVRGD